MLVEMECFLEMTINEIANFFWHGPNLSVYEIHCLKSFVRHNFTVNLWTFGPINAPSGVNVCDASKFYAVDDIQTFNQRGKQGCLAAFSDAFRYKVLKHVGGWWFDTDCLCLRDQSEFAKLCVDRSIVAGYENGRGDINGAAIRFVSEPLLDQAIEMMEQKLIESNRSFSWGAIGPKLVTELVKKNNLANEVLPLEYFYPIHCKRASDAIDPNTLQSVKTQCSNAYVYHCWNEMLTRAGVDKNKYPPTGSYLNEKFSELDQ